MGDNVERSFIMVKPDGIHRGVVGEIIKRFEQRGYRLVAMKFVWVRDVTGQITVLSYGFLRLKFNKILRYSRRERTHLAVFFFFFQSTAQLQYVDDSEPVTRST